MPNPVTREDFVEHFPSFDKTAPELIQKKLDMAHRQLNTEIWGSAYEDGVRYLTARLLALEPGGRKMRLVNKDGSTIFDDDLMRLKRSVASGCRVI